MNKPTKSLTDTKREAMHIRSSPSQKPFISPETLEHMRNTEAKEWIKRYREKMKEVGPNEARKWWDRTVSHIERIRGQDAAFDLRQRMNKFKDI
jgi:hypothetical protein